MPRQTIITANVKFQFSPDINGKPGFSTSGKSSFKASKVLGTTLRASTWDYQTKTAIGGSTSPIKGKNLFLWWNKEDYSDSVGKKLVQKYEAGAFFECAIDASTGQLLDWGEPMTLAEFNKAKLELTETNSIALVAV